MTDVSFCEVQLAGRGSFFYSGLPSGCTRE